MQLPAPALVAAGVLLALGGCSPDSSEPNATPKATLTSDSSALNTAPDATLTYDMVAQDVAKYRGKRVRWLGQFTGGRFKDKTPEKGTSFDAVFVDTNADLHVHLRAFAVQGESEKSSHDLRLEIMDKPVWVTGTVAGTRHEKLTVGPPPEERELDIPLLESPRFEPSESAANKGGNEAPEAGKPTDTTATMASATASTSPPGEISEKWQTDFSVFASQIEKFRKTKEGQSSADSFPSTTYENKRVRWTLMLKSVSHDGDKDSIDFDLEPYGIKYKFFSGTRLILTGFQPAKTALPDWQKIKPGVRVTFEGICERVFFPTITPEGGVGRLVAGVRVSDLTPVKMEQSENDLTGTWDFFMRTNQWTVQLTPRDGLPGEYKGTARRDEKGEKGKVVIMELGAALTKGKLKAWLGPGFVVCEAPFSVKAPMKGKCKVGIGSGSPGPFRASRQQ